MSTPDLKHLFVPGDGNVPPYLAGRKEEQAYFQDCVDVLKNKRPAPRNLILYGPRGNGKTALLEYLQTKTRQKERDQLEILWVTPDKMATQSDLAHLLKGKNKLKGLLRNVTGSAGTWFGSASIGVDLSASSSVELEDQIRKKCKRKPFILIIDEAHRLQPVVAESLLNASQIVRKTSPFLLVLAGTPNLRDALGKANASFWDRSEIVRLGRLSPEEAGQALTVPLQEVGITFAPGAIEHIVEQTHWYPFFTQVWGNGIAQQLQQTGEQTISMETVKIVQPTVTDKYNAMYQVRRNEINDIGLLSIAESIAETFMRSGEAQLYENTLEEAIAQGMADEGSITDQLIREKLKQLSHLGYVWQSKEGGYEPGIPSLLSYVISQAQLHGKARPPVTEQGEQWRITPKGHDTDMEM